ncbi:MAG TPA: hypothetical protein VGH87_18395 [Polyangiaceae bacterium]
MSGTAFAIFACGSLGALLPVALLQALGVHSGVVALLAFPGAIAGLAGAYMAGDRLNNRINRLRAPIGSASVGADGIRWRHFGRTEFIAWSSVREIDQRGQVVVVHREGGNATLVIQQAELFADAARRALHAYQNDERSENIAALEFTGDSISDWLVRARALLQGSSYRDAHVGEERCVRVAIDPRAPIAQRIGSAAALSKASDEARRRVRVAIEETADPEVANALEDALDAKGDERALGRVMQRTR